MSYVLTLDFETRDPSISNGRGAGWPFKDFEVIGAAYQVNEGEPVWTTNMQEIKEVVSNGSTIIAHNAQYDCGCLSRLGISFDHMVVVDTIILAKLFDNRLRSYSLDDLSLDFLGESKDYAVLEEAAAELGISKPMSKIYELFTARPDVVAQYAKQDVRLAYKLSQWFKKELYQEGLDLIPFYSDLIKALVKWRGKGVHIDLSQVEKSSSALHTLETEAKEEFEKYCRDVAISSTKQLSEAFQNLGLVVGTSKSGGPSVDAAWRKTQNHPAIDALSRAKLYEKLRRDFVDALVERSEDGKIYPNLNILGAVETGRFTSTSPNIQQIPKRDPISTSLIRSLIRGPKDYYTYSLDFSSQEPRLQVHYAYLAQCEGADILRQSFIDNPKHDLHQQVADMAGIDRKTAKTINLGISYGMGIGKLAVTLKLSEEKARELVGRYRKMAPYLHMLNKKVQESGTAKGYIKTLLGRRLKMDNNKPYTALNKLIQGSAADQTTMAMVEAYRQGIDIMFSVHDELVMTAKTDEDALRLKHIMENVGNLTVPSVIDIVKGDSWKGED